MSKVLLSVTNMFHKVKFFNITSSAIVQQAMYIAGGGNAYQTANV